MSAVAARAREEAELSVAHWEKDRKKADDAKKALADFKKERVPAAEGKVVNCYFYARGICNRGLWCKFAHSPQFPKEG